MLPETSHLMREGTKAGEETTLRAGNRPYCRSQSVQENTQEAWLEGEGGARQGRAGKGVWIV